MGMEDADGLLRSGREALAAAGLEQGEGWASDDDDRPPTWRAREPAARGGRRVS